MAASLHLGTRPPPPSRPHAPGTVSASLPRPHDWPPPPMVSGRTPVRCHTSNITPYPLASGFIEKNREVPHSHTHSRSALSHTLPLLCYRCVAASHRWRAAKSSAWATIDRSPNREPSRPLLRAARTAHGQPPVTSSSGHSSAQLTCQWAPPRLHAPLWLVAGCEPSPLRRAGLHPPLWGPHYGQPTSNRVQLLLIFHEH
jgi:hypothetical protein